MRSRPPGVAARLRKKSVCALLAAGLLLAATVSRAAEEVYVFDRISIEQGLSQSSSRTATVSCGSARRTG
jgi:hypothetical protein